MAARRLVLVFLILFLAAPILSAGCAGDDDQFEGDDDSEDGPEDDDDDEHPSQPDPLQAVYDVTGTGPVWGDYTGSAELRWNPGTYTYRVYHTALYEDAVFEEDRVASAWQGEATRTDSGFIMEVELDRVGFINSYGEETREGAETESLVLTAAFSKGDSGSFSADYLPASGGDPVFAEVWTRSSPVGAEPIWKSERELIASHAPPPGNVKDMLFDLFTTYYAREELQPYLDRPEFWEAVHYFVRDSTDFGFYRENPDVLRVIQKVIDPISLVETRIRNRAFRMTLAQKAAFYDENMRAFHINGAGMLAGRLAGTDPPVHMPDMSSMLWTGVYIESQALRFRVTREPEALENVLTCLEGQFLCYDIVAEPGQFARSVRPHDGNSPDDWVRGEGEYAGYDYLPGGNNDMLHGYNVGFLFAWIALDGLSGYEYYRQKMVEIIQELLEYNEIARDGMIHEMKMNMLLYLLTDQPQYRDRYRELWQTWYLRFFITELGNGSFYIYGISDWSGNHLNLQSMTVLALGADLVGDPETVLFRKGCRRTVVMMRHTNLGFYQLTMGLLGDFDSPPPELEDAVWKLREFPAPKVHHNIDWRINPVFCMSPFPSLPWKFDWGEPGSPRLFSLVSYPLFEQGTDNFIWRGGPFNFRDGESGMEDHAADYLAAYWFGRAYLLIDEED